MQGTGKVHNPRESSIGREFRKKATAQGLKVIKIHGGPYQEKGLPDYLIRPRRTLNRFRGDGLVGHPCWVELKKVGGRPPEGLQLHTAADLAERGDVVIFANNAAAAVACIMGLPLSGGHTIPWPSGGCVIDLIGIADEWLRACGIVAVLR